MAEAKGSYVGGTPVYFKDEKARAMLSNEYVHEENYDAGNLCIHEGKLYKATKATTGTWDATAWTETNLAEVNAGMQKSITDLTENKVWVKSGELSGTIIGKNIPIAVVGDHTPNEFLVEWRLFPTHPWNYVIVNAASAATTDKHIGSFYFSQTFYASFSFILSGGRLSVESSYTGGKHGSTDLANPENAKIVLYYK